MSTVRHRKKSNEKKDLTIEDEVVTDSKEKKMDNGASAASTSKVNSSSKDGATTPGSLLMGFINWFAPSEQEVEYGANTYWLTRSFMLRLVGFVCFSAFLSAFNHVEPLIGENGLLPVQQHMAFIENRFGRHEAMFKYLPSIFWWIGAEDSTLVLGTVVGMILSVMVMLGCANMLVVIALFILQTSFTNLGQLFWSYGWEPQLMETLFLLVWSCPLLSLSAYSRRSAPPFIGIILMRLFIAKVHIGAGLIKWRGDPCWRDLTCMEYHYETQPEPGPLSWYMHQSPLFFHQFEVIVMYVVEIIAPLLMFVPWRPARLIGGVLQVGFQMVLIVSGNLLFINYLTIVPCLAFLDDKFFLDFVPFASRLAGAPSVSNVSPASAKSQFSLLRFVRLMVVGTAASYWLYLMAIGPVPNLFSENQVMNRSYLHDPLRICNAYGMFGGLTKQRYEVIIEGTNSDRIDKKTKWKAYEFGCKPNKVDEMPCYRVPYHYRLTWQLWFAAFQQNAYSQNWLLHLTYKLLNNDKTALNLLEHNPFPETPPKFIRMRRVLYRFTRDFSSKKWWEVGPESGEYMRPMSLNTKELIQFIEQSNWPLLRQ